MKWSKYNLALRDLHLIQNRLKDQIATSTLKIKENNSSHKKENKPIIHGQRYEILNKNNKISSKLNQNIKRMKIYLLNKNSHILIANNIIENEVIKLKQNKYQSNQTKVKLLNPIKDESNSPMNDVDEDLVKSSNINNDTDIQLSYDEVIVKYENANYIRDKYNQRSRQLTSSKIDQNNTQYAYHWLWAKLI